MQNPQSYTMGKFANISLNSGEFYYAQWRSQGQDFGGGLYKLYSQEGVGCTCFLRSKLKCESRAVRLDMSRSLLIKLIDNSI
jgi:hypothetical protein